MPSGAAVDVQSELAAREAHRPGTQPPSRTAGDLRDQTVPQEHGAADASHSGSALRLSVADAEPSVVHPDLVAALDHSDAHVDLAAVERSVRTRLHERGSLRPRPADPVPARGDLDLEVVGVVVEGGRKHQIDRIGEGVDVRRGIVQVRPRRVALVRSQDPRRPRECAEGPAFGAGHAPDRAPLEAGILVVSQVADVTAQVRVVEADVARVGVPVHQPSDLLPVQPVGRHRALDRRPEPVEDLVPVVYGHAVPVFAALVTMSKDALEA